MRLKPSRFRNKIEGRVEGAAGPTPGANSPNLRGPGAVLSCAFKPPRARTDARLSKKPPRALPLFPASHGGTQML